MKRHNLSKATQERIAGAIRHAQWPARRDALIKYVHGSMAEIAPELESELLLAEDREYLSPDEVLDEIERIRLNH